MLLSTLPGRALQAVQNAGLPSLHVKPLQKEEKGEIIVGYLTNFYGKTLKQELTQLIIDAEPTNNALYLRSLLDEVRLFGSFEQLGNKVREYLTAGTPGDLFAKILARLEGDFEDESRPGLVKDTTAAIWCSHKGMSEGELRDLLDVPPAVWSPFYLSLEDNLVNRNGILNFFHDHLRQAVESKYLPTEEEKLKGYKTLAEFFEKRELDGRKVEELPFLQSKAGELEKLQATISDLNIFKRLVESEDGKFDLIKYWTKVGGYSKAEEAYTAALDSYPADQRDTVEYHALQVNLADFYMDTGLLSAARVMLEKVLAKAEEKYIHSHGTVVYNFKCHSWRHKSNHPDVIDLLQKLGTVCHKQSVLREAELYFNDAIARQNRIITPSQKLKLTEGLLGLAAVKVSKDEAIQAKRILIRARELATEVLGSRHHYVSAIINKIGQLTYKQGRLEESLGYFLQDLKLTRGEVGTAHPRVAGILNDIALVYDDGNDPLAEELYEAALAVLVETYGPEHLDVAIVRYNLGAVYFATNHFAKAKYQFEHCAATFKAFLGEDHVQTKDALSALNDVKGLVK
ncbi:TPR repeat-containing protein DDB_G0287407-like [Lingula anatina]|uniref:TPR repeat-containing protein DDB_G0287407-like n=1 Tax=Lingula anatina TaxID=7574 RepID=A0A1S3HNZ1_LINAN|nr:TPR repeat-containing protein DDB_G0287407-like [Lingula anatina]|eukprot:XP_013386754.1 TPR repeat-containing protein DDB_G0287407-like [Lingula anatina]